MPTAARSSCRWGAARGSAGSWRSPRARSGTRSRSTCTRSAQTRTAAKRWAARDPASRSTTATVRASTTSTTASPGKDDGRGAGAGARPAACLHLSPPEPAPPPAARARRARTRSRAGRASRRSPLSAGPGTRPTRRPSARPRRRPSRTRGPATARRTARRRCGRSRRRRHPRYRYTDHAVAGDDVRELLLGHPLGALGPHRKDDVTHVGARVPDADLHVVAELEAELLQHRPRLADDPGAVGRALVPDRRHAQHRPRVAGTQGADDDVVDGGRVLDAAQVLPL